MIRVVVNGKPVAKARPRPARNGGVWSPSKKDEEFVAFHFTKYRDSFPTGQVKVRMLFLCNPRQRADNDNLEKLVSDAITKAGVWGDDFQAYDVHHRRLVVEAGQEKTIVWLARPGEPFVEYDGVIREADERGL